MALTEEQFSLATDILTFSNMEIAHSLYTGKENQLVTISDCNFKTELFGMTLISLILCQSCL